VLSSAVTVADRSDELRLYSVPGRAGLGGWPATSPSVIGEGEDLIASPAEAPGLESLLKEQRTEIGREASEVWRIRRGVARFPVDLAEDSVPAEGGLEHLIDAEKGCFPGQESVAKIRNLGHPSRVIRALRSEAELQAGTEVVADHVGVGLITSAAPAAEGGTACLARIRWAAAERGLATRDGAPLTLVDPSA
jgi:folate-binding protein YgfZ